MSGLRVGVDVGGTFTKAVAVEFPSLALRAQAAVPTTHEARDGVAEGLVAVLERLLAALGERRQHVELVAFSTTQAMNALLEGDVARVGIVGIGEAPDLRLARKRTRVRAVKLAPGHALQTEHEFLDASGGLLGAQVDAALARLTELGCAAIAASGAFAVDSPDEERFVTERALARGLPACAGHELTGAYGLETRTVTAAINASILPIVERTAALVEQALAEAGLRVPLLVLRGDGGAMSLTAFRHAPSFTIGSAPAAGVAAALHQLGLRDAIVVECGGTSSNVSVVKRGRPILRSLRVMGRPTCVRAVDSWVVGAAGGSMARLDRRSIAEVGPRSAHIAGLPYACFAHPEALAGAQLELIAPRAGDPAAYAAVRASGRRYALTATCAANALGLVPPGTYPHGSQQAALAAFLPLAERLAMTPEGVARRLLTGAAEKVAQAAAEAAREHELGREVPIVALGGAGEVLLPEVAQLLGRSLLRPEYPEVLSAIGAALSLVRAEVTRSAAGQVSVLAAAREAERACVDSGAAPSTITVESSFDTREGLVRAVATGAVALERGAATREPADEQTRLGAAAEALGIDPSRLSPLARNDFYLVYSENTENGSCRIAVVDAYGSVPLADTARRVIAGRSRDFLERLQTEVAAGSLQLGLATILPRVTLVCGPRILDLSEARRAEDIVGAAELALGEETGPAVALLAR